MKHEVESAALVARCGLRVLAEADPGVLARILERFQHLNVVPRRVVAELGTDQMLHLQVDVSGLSEDRLAVLAAKMAQFPPVMRAYWFRI